MWDDARDLLGAASWEERVDAIERRQAEFAAGLRRADRIATVAGLAVIVVLLALLCVLRN
jgi:hypothetical protein